jgi:hypothetical protein
VEQRRICFFSRPEHSLSSSGPDGLWIIDRKNPLPIFPTVVNLKTNCEPCFFIPRLAMVLPMVVLYRRVPLIQALS